jgi:MoxR-like ATPase
MPIKEKIKRILEKISQGVYEKEEAIRLSLLSALAGESIFLLGPPGVAKSLIARKLKFAFRNGKSFEYLMNKFSTPDEVFGPVSIRKLKEEDKYERLTDKYLPGAHVVFLDELWKAGPAIQNALLTILNEKIYRNGEQEIKVNIKGIIAASNELPNVHEGLDALWDRFLLRYMITEIRSAGNFVGMIVSTEDVYEDTLAEEDKIAGDELLAWEKAIDQVEVPAEVINVIQLVKHQLDQYDQTHETGQFRIYDRRWKKIIRLLRTSAFLNERPKVDLMDCFLMPHCLWSQPEQLEIAQEIVAETIRKHGYTIALNLTAIKGEIRDFEEDVNRETRIPNVVVSDQLMPVERDYYEALNIEQYFDGNRVKRAEYDKLLLEEDVAISLYDAAGNLTNKVKARKSRNPNEIQVTWNSRTYSFPMRTVKAEKTEVIYKKPHPVMYQYYADRARKLENYILEQKEKVKENAPTELRDLRNNLFVEAQLAQIVEVNLKEAVQTLETLALKVEKIRFSYENLMEK